MKKSLVIKSLIFILWCTLIFLFSKEDSASSNDRSKSITADIVQVVEKVTHIKISNSKKIINKMNYYIRKLAHFSIYFVLGILSFVCLREFNLPLKKAMLFSILFCLIYAFGDEFHQLFVSGRTGQIKDVIIDTTGGIIGVFTFKKVKKIN